MQSIISLSDSALLKLQKSVQDSDNKVERCMAQVENQCTSRLAQ